MTITLFFLLLISSFLGSLWGFCLFLLFCKIFKPRFFSYMMLEREMKKAPMKDRRTVEGYSANANFIPKKPEPMKSFMSAILDSQSSGGDMLFAKGQSRFGSERTVYEMCDEDENAIQGHTSEDLYKIFSDADNQVPPQLMPIRETEEDEGEVEDIDEKEYSELEDDDDTDDADFQAEAKTKYQKPISKPENNETEKKENVTMSISPGATGGNVQKRKRGRPPKNSNK